MSNDNFSLISQTDSKDTVKVMVEMDGNLGRTFQALAKANGLTYAEAARQMIRYCVKQQQSPNTTPSK